MANYYSSEAIEKNGRELFEGSKVNTGETVIGMVTMETPKGTVRMAGDDSIGLYSAWVGGNYGEEFRVFAVPTAQLEECKPATPELGREPYVARPQAKASSAPAAQYNA